MSTAKTILITGGNRGIGYGTVVSLARRSSDNTIIIATRQRVNAQTAIDGLQAEGWKGPFYPLALDVTDDESIRSAVKEVDEKFGKLDVLINNSGIASLESDISDFRGQWTEIFNTNVFGVRILTEYFLPLLRKSADPRVVNVSSKRGSFHSSTTGQNPPTAAVAYSASKSALNMLTVEMGKKNPDVMFQTVCPGHCKTAFNGYRGKRDPMDGGDVAAEIALAEKGQYPVGFWDNEGPDMTMQSIQW